MCDTYFFWIHTIFWCIVIGYIAYDSGRTRGWTERDQLDCDDNDVDYDNYWGDRKAYEKYLEDIKNKKG